MQRTSCLSIKQVQHALLLHGGAVVLAVDAMIAAAGDVGLVTSDPSSAPEVEAASAPPPTPGPPAEAPAEEDSEE